MTNKKIVDGSKCKPLTLEEAKALTYRQEVYCRLENDSRGSLKKVRVNGIPRVWKTRPNEVSVPYKYGLNGYGAITNWNLENWTLESEPFERFKNVRVCPATGQEWMLVEYTWRFLSENQLLGQDDIHHLIVELTGAVIEQTSNGKEFNMHYELYEVLPNRMQQFAPANYYYGTHEADGEWGFWPSSDDN
jgi:hypothetical protein